MNILSQILANVIISWSMIFLVGISFLLIFSTARFFHFGHASVITVGAYICYYFIKIIHFPAPISILMGIVVAAVLGYGLELIIFKRMRLNGASSLTLLLASIGGYIVIQNIISLFFGDQIVVLNDSILFSSISIVGSKITAMQLLLIGLAILFLLSKIYLIDKTKLGLALRAVSDNPELASISGIDEDKIMFVAFFLSSILGGIAGIVRAFDIGMTPTTGLDMLLSGVVAVVIGGNGATIGVAVASILLASFQQFASWQFGEMWKDSITFAVLLAYLLLRPQGIYIKSIRKTEV
jgi:branched-chain amino acid transport system permease protein